MVGYAGGCRNEQGPCDLFLFHASNVLLVVGEGIFGIAADFCTVVVESVRDGAACQGEERKKRARPLVSEPVVHLRGKKDSRSTPHGSQKGLCSEGRCSLMLVSVHC